MGSQNSKFLSEQELPQQYIPLKQQPGIYESILNGTRLQKHKIQLYSEAEINYEKQIFVFRRMHAQRLITASFFQKFLPSHFCNMSYEVSFFTQHPSYVLSLDLVIPTQKAFQLLIETLQGFQILFHQFGVFSVGYNNVFFNIHHEPKVWISSDLGKTKIENNKNVQMDQQRMILDIFRLYDQLKDERNFQFSFSAYLRKLKEKTSKLTFKNVISYLIEEASKFFQRRMKPREFQQMQKQNFVLSNNPSIVNDIRQIKNSKDNRSANTISLKSNNRLISKNPSTTGTYSHFGATFNQSGCCNFKQESDKFKKPKRHNSQEDCCNNREINFYKKNYRNGTQEVVWLPNNRATHYRLGQTNTEENKQKASDPNTIRMFRRSLDEDEKPRKIQQNLQYMTKRINEKQQSEQKQESKGHLYNIVQTQKQMHEMVNIQQIKLPKKNACSSALKHVLFENPRKSNGSGLGLGNKAMVAQMVESNLALSNLRTLKSIINSEYSEMDSQIREDLENMNF